MDAFISSQMAMKMTGSSNVSFEIGKDTDKLVIEKEDAINIQIQTNRNWVLRVKSESTELQNSTSKSTIPLANLRLRANSGSFVNLNTTDTNLIKGNKGSYQSLGNNISIDYELPYNKKQSAGNYEVTLVFTLAAI